MNFINLAIVLTLTSGTVFAQSDSDIAEQCKSAHPAFSEIFKRNECISNAKKTRAEVEARAKREEAARPCLAKAIPALENTIKELGNNISHADTLVVAAAKVAKVTGNKFQIEPSENNIKKMIAVDALRSKCVSDFYYLINIVQGEDGKLESFKVWTETPPKGYINGNANGYRPEFSVDYVAKRKAQLIDSNKSFKNSKNPAGSKDDFLSDLNMKNHCAPEISKKERLSRLSTHGQLNQTSERTYKAGKHGVSFHYDGSLSYCY